MMAHILFTRVFDILCNIFASTVYVHIMMQILQTSKLVLDLTVTLLSNLWFGIGYF